MTHKLGSPDCDPGSLICSVGVSDCSFAHKLSATINYIQLKFTSQAKLNGPLISPESLGKSGNRVVALAASSSFNFSLVFAKATGRLQGGVKLLQLG